MISPKPLIVILLIAISMSYGYIDSGEISYNNYEPNIYCGRRLAKIMAGICKYEKSDKRSDMGTMYGSILAPYYKDEENQVGWPWIPPHKARSLGLPNRGKRVIVTECCEKPCTYDELHSFC